MKTTKGAYMGDYLPLVLWGIVFAVAVIAEFAFLQLISIWFTAGALAAFFVALFDGTFLLQLALFTVVSVVLLLFTRPIVRKVMHFDVKNTNQQELGRVATVIQSIDAAKGTGRVRLDGVDWIAIAQNEETIPKDMSVCVKAVDGTKLIVAMLPEAEMAESTN
ncbi:MAG: NfeD family protein [Ruminococcus sp.]|nr:NfeD family protein [Ruminococcus sp.]